MSKKVKAIIVTLIVVLAAVLGVVIATSIINAGSSDQAPVNEIETAEKNVPALVSTSFSKVEVVNTPTIMGISSQSFPNEEESYLAITNNYITRVRTESPFAFKDDVIGRCIDTDFSWGAQCYDLGNVFWQNYANRTLSTCGTGAAKGIMNCWGYNAGSEFDMIWDASELQPGDWAIFGSGEFGHIGMAMGYYNHGFIALLGQNQGGSYCEGGGSSANIINISLRDFKGAFRPKIYVQPPAPQPVSPDTGIPK